MNIFSIPNLISIKIQNYSGSSLSINNISLPSPSEVDISAIGFSVSSFQDYITKVKPGLYALLSNPRIKINLVPITSTSSVSPAVSTPEPAVKVKKEKIVEEVKQVPVIEPTVEAVSVVEETNDSVSFVVEATEDTDGEFNPFDPGAEETVTVEEEVSAPTEAVVAPVVSTKSSKKSKKKN